MRQKALKDGGMAGKKQRGMHEVEKGQKNECLW